MSCKYKAFKDVFDKFLKRLIFSFLHVSLINCFPNRYLYENKFTLEEMSIFAHQKSQK